MLFLQNNSSSLHPIYNDVQCLLFIFFLVRLSEWFNIVFLYPYKIRIKTTLYIIILFVYDYTYLTSHSVKERKMFHNLDNYNMTTNEDITSYHLLLISLPLETSYIISVFM